MDKPERQSAQRLRDTHRLLVAAANGDRNLTAAGRQRMIAESTTATKTKLRELREQERARLVARHEELESQLFGSRISDAGSAIVARDAKAKAEGLVKARDALAMLQEAERDGDTVLARAVARVAAERSNGPAAVLEPGWQVALDRFVDARPHMAEVVNELADVETTLSAPLATDGAFGMNTIGAAYAAERNGQ